MNALREIIARFGISFDDSALKKGDKAIDGVAEKLANFGKVLAGAAIVTGITNFITGIADQADALSDHAKVLGLSTTELQEWQYAAKMSGVEAGELGGALTKFNKNVADAAAGTGPAADAFRSLGVSVKDSSGKLAQPIDLLGGLAEGLKKIENPAERTNTLMSLFGKSGAKLGPLFAEGAEGIAKLRKEVADLGGGMSTEFIESAADMNDSIDRLSFSWLGFKSRMAGLIIPTVDRFVRRATTIASAITRWIDKTNLLSEGSARAATAAGVLGIAFMRAGVKAITPWLPMIAALGAAYIALNELIVLWQGGDTLIGRAIDSIFGEGTAKKVVAIGHEIADMFGQAGQSSEDFYRVIDGVWKGIVLAAAIAAEQVRKTWNGVGAAMYDAVNDPLREAKNAEIDKQIEQAKVNAAATPGSEEWLKKRIAELEASKEKSQSQINDETSAWKAQQFVDQYDRLSKQLDPKLHSPAGQSEAAMRQTGLSGPGLPPGMKLPAATPPQVVSIPGPPTHVTVPGPASSSKTTTTVNDSSIRTVHINIPPGSNRKEIEQIVRDEMGRGSLATHRALVRTLG